MSPVRGAEIKKPRRLTAGRFTYQVEVGKLRERELASQQALEVSDRVRSARADVEADLYERLDRAASHQHAAARRGLADAQEKVRVTGDRLFVAGGPRAAELLLAYLSDRAQPVSRPEVSDHLRGHATAAGPA